MKNRTHILLILTALAFVFSFLQDPKESSIEREAERLQRRVTERQLLLEDYVRQALITPEHEWLNLPDLPEDMVIYRFANDTLQSWAHLFPIGNDEIRKLPLMHRIHDRSISSFYNTPLAYLPQHDQYTNLGSAWYITRVYRSGKIKLVTGLWIRSEYAPENAMLKNETNPALNLNRSFTTVPISENPTHLIWGKDGDPLFSLTSTTPLTANHPFTALRWLALLFALGAIFSMHEHQHSLRSWLITALGLVAIRLLMFTLLGDIRNDSPLISPTLYADTHLFNSLAKLLANHLFVFLQSLAIVMASRALLHRISQMKPIWKRSIQVGLTAWSAVLILYIHETLRSVLLNSNIVLELFRLEEISGYSVLIYGVYFLLFLGLLLVLRLSVAAWGQDKKYRKLTFRSLSLYTLCVSLYLVFSIGFYGFTREAERCKIWSSKLSVDRDLALELQLKEMEDEIANDRIIKALMLMNRGTEIIRDRISEQYLWNILQTYDVHIYVCNSRDVLQTDNYAHPVNCYQYLNREIIEQYGIPLSSTSSFFYINDYKSNASYIGSFPMLLHGNHYNLYVRIRSKLSTSKHNEVIGYPSLLLDQKKLEGNSLPSYYSFAKYYQNRLISDKGRYNYPVHLDFQVADGYSNVVINDYQHFINKVSDDRIIMISRAKRSLFSYILFYSYLTIFFGVLFFAGTYSIRRKNRITRMMTRNSLRRKITFLLTTVLVFALICMGAGSVIFALNIMQENNRIQMEEKMATAVNSLTERCRYAKTLKDLNTQEFYNAMDRISNNTQVDINLFDPHGHLIRSTKNEVFERMLVSSRMNPAAFESIQLRNQKLVILDENVASQQFTSLYAPIFNSSGRLIAILNIPYFASYTGLEGDAATIIAAIINIYLLLILTALFAGTIVSNSLTRPLAELSKKMEQTDITQKAEHIDYQGQDEIGIVVNTYNKMVDDLERSSRQLAESEREQAWREMARQIAHEIKNPLTPMRLSIQHLRRMQQQNIPDWDKKFWAVSTSLLEQIDILSDTAAEFSNFAKFYNEEITLVDLCALLKDQILLFNNRDNVLVSFESNAEAACVHARRSQITRVFVNLISNAIQAVEGGDQGHVHVSLIAEEESYRIQVEDNGSGVSEENLNKLFKPNFTTKTGGTGLGLAICKNIVEQSNGSIHYQRSEKMGGANFYLLLPKYNAH